MKKFLSVLAILVLTGCGWVSDNYQWIDARHKTYYETRGFKVMGYQGYNMWTTGRCYWYTLQRGNTVYESCLMKWGDEVHEYSLRAIDAVKGS